MYADIVLSLRLLRPPHLSARFGRVWQLVQSRRKFVYCNAPHPTTIACCDAQLTFLSHTCARRYIFCSLASTFALLTRSTTLSSSSFDADMFRSTSPVLVFSLHAVLSNWSNVDARPVHRVQQACNVYACRKPPCTVGVCAPGAAIRGFGTRNTGDTEMVLRRCPPYSLTCSPTHALPFPSSRIVGFPCSLSRSSPFPQGVFVRETERKGLFRASVRIRSPISTSLYPCRMFLSCPWGMEF